MDDLNIEMTGATELELRGRGKEMRVDLLAASHLYAGNYTVRDASIEAHAASTADVYVTNKLEIEEKLASRVVNKGSAREVTTKNRFDEDN